MPDMHKFIEDLKTARDETKLKIHLGSKELQEEWAELEKRWHTFKTKAELESRTGEECERAERRRQADRI